MKCKIMLVLTLNVKNPAQEELKEKQREFLVCVQIHGFGSYRHLLSFNAVLHSYWLVCVFSYV